MIGAPDLPYEIWSHIFSYFQKESMRETIQYRRVSKNFNEFLIGRIKDQALKVKNVLENSSEYWLRQLANAFVTDPADAFSRAAETLEKMYRNTTFFRLFLRHIVEQKYLIGNNKEQIEKYMKSILEPLEGSLLEAGDADKSINDSTFYNHWHGEIADNKKRY